MSWVSGVAIYIVIWWLALFLVLPWGIRPIDAGDVAKGHAAGAPVRANMWWRMAATSLVAALFWLIFYYLFTRGFISFRP